jgi:hypothetical protein
VQAVGSQNMPFNIGLGKNQSHTKRRTTNAWGGVFEITSADLCL